MNSLTGDHENIVICDIAVDEKSCTQLKYRLNELSKVSNVIFMDHHPLPEKGFNAIYGAMGDFNETEVIEKWMQDWDKRTLYFYADVLIQGITYADRDYDYKRRIVDALSENKPPPWIEGLLDAAVIASQKEEEIKLKVRHDVVKLKNIAYVIDVNGYLSKSAIYAAAYGDARVGIACEHRSHKHFYDLSIRRRDGDSDLNLILRRVATEHDGTGGGHPFAGGARIPEKNLKPFLDDLDYALG
ncbi:DHHA1 domain protein [uncultured archaeon]|nr:DHHA1 domain protein [uncultured archaeon]